MKLDAQIREERFQVTYKGFSEEVIATCTDVLYKDVRKDARRVFGKVGF